MKISIQMKNHYKNCFNKYGPTSQGIDWGEDESKLLLRYEKMTNLFLANDYNEKFTLLDVGCGYGGYFSYLKNKELKVDYSGIDIVEDMILWGKNNSSDTKGFICGDFLNYNFTDNYDYIICNGILTQKLEATNMEMDSYSLELIKKMFNICNKGIAFNLMTTKVNYFSNNLYYKSPVEMLSFCMNELSSNIRIDHSYLYEYTVYVYK